MNSKDIYPCYAIIGINKTVSHIISNLKIDNAENVEIYEIDNKEIFFKNIFNQIDIVYVVIDLDNNMDMASMVIETLTKTKALCIPILIQDDSLTVTKENLKNIQKITKSVVLITKKNAQLISMEVSKIINIVSELILSQGLINLDFADFLTVMNVDGITRINSIECISSNILEKVISDAAMINNNAKAVLFNFTTHSNFHDSNIINTMEKMIQVLNEDTNIIMGIAYDDLLDTNSIKISMIVSGM